MLQDLVYDGRIGPEDTDALPARGLAPLYGNRAAEFAASDMRVLINFLFPRKENLSVLSPPLQVVLYPDRDLLPNHTLRNASCRFGMSYAHLMC